MNDHASQGNNGSAVGVTTKLHLKTEVIDAAAPVLTKLAVASTKFPKLLSVEISSPNKVQTEWTIVQRFATEGAADAWKNSSERKEILQQLTPFLSDSGVADETSEQQCDQSVAACISSVVKPGLEENYYKWLHDIQTAQAVSSGYDSTYLQVQKSGESNQWTTVLRFKSPEALDQWFKSRRRLELLEQAKQFISQESIKTMTSSFPGWLPVDEQGESPPNWKVAMLVVLGLYPIVCLQIRFLSPALASMKLALANLIGNFMSVALVTWMTMPFLNMVFGKWLLPPKNSNRTQIELIGLAALILLFIGEVWLFWDIIP